ncbi:hypothetical protein LAH08_05704 [Micromonospora noduli]|uniref:Uncharacterized protein n=1 Tax=Micromonospora noduli TaxID=709876 RepID=A0A328N291_9ACTN|nr:hypothetical protein LAH08_05704 [Micromonospora noduli]
MNLPTPLECVNGDAREGPEGVTHDASESEADRRHRRRVELLKVLPALLLALAALVTAIR